MARIRRAGRGNAADAVLGLIRILVAIYRDALTPGSALSGHTRQYSVSLHADRARFNDRVERQVGESDFNGVLQFVGVPAEDPDR